MPSPADAWVVTRRTIEWHPYTRTEPRPLGRNVHHDSRSLMFRHERRHVGRKLVEVMHKREVPIFDQGEVGDCTTNAGTGAAGTDPLFPALAANVQHTLNEALCVSMYSDEERILYGQPYPPQDGGGDGLTTCKVMQQRKLISGYTHCLGLDDFLDALQDHAVMAGMNWYDSMDAPDSAGIVAISRNASVRGGHEVLARGYDPLSDIVWFDNSWGTGFGVGGSFGMKAKTTLARLLGEQGDGTVPLPVTAPAPTPTPVPVPTPTPGPSDPAGDALWSATRDWAHERHVDGNRKAAQAVLAWGAATGRS